MVSGFFASIEFMKGGLDNFSESSSANPVVELGYYNLTTLPISLVIQKPTWFCLKKERELCSAKKYKASDMLLNKLIRKRKVNPWFRFKKMLYLNLEPE